MAGGAGVSAEPIEIVTLPEPYYADDAVALYHGDCLDLLPLLPDKSVAHVITDPPYEAEAHTKARRQSRGPDTLAEEHEIDFAPITEPTREAIATHAARLVLRWALIFCQVEAVGTWRSSVECAGLRWVRGQGWVKPDGTPQFTGDRPAQGFECIATAHARGRMRWNGGGRRGVYFENVNDYGRRTNGRPHPTQKPLALMSELVRLFTDPGETILDPFAGSGTTGIAARMEGRRAILIEREERYCEVAARRLEHMPRGTDAQPGLFDEALP